MSRDWQLYWDDMIESCRRVSEYTHGMDREAFFSDQRTCDAVIRNLEVLGEAAKKIPDDVKAAHHSIAWRKLAGLRDVLAHAYFNVDQDILWDVVSNKVPELLQLMQREQN